MRIGIDLLAAQSPHHARRGIGRYARHLADALLLRADRDGDHYVLYRRPDLADPGLQHADRGTIRDLDGDGPPGAAAEGDRLTRDNPDRLDALLVLSPFESWSAYLPPVPQGEPAERPALASILYDMIPFLSPPEVLPLDPDLRRTVHAARSLRRYDALLAISDSTARDAVRILGVDSNRVANVGAASDPLMFFPPTGPEDADRPTLAALGINRPYVMCLGGMDPRKNFHGLVDAFAKLPDALRLSHQLVVACHLSADAQIVARRHAQAWGVLNNLVLVGEVSDPTLRTLYQRCAVFAFPSLYEGFGLPILEALHCGVPVVAGNNSSQPEVVGDAGLLADPSDADAFGAALGRSLTCKKIAARFRANAIAQSALFAWPTVAGKVREAVVAAVASKLDQAPKLRRGRAKNKPFLALVSPFPPRGSGISDYAVRLLDELRCEYRVDLIHDGVYAPTPALADAELVTADIRTLPALAASGRYRGIVYQMGNSRFHSFLYSTMIALPGVVTLHDFCLSGFHQVYPRRYGVRGDHFRYEMDHCHPGRYAEIADLADARPADFDRVMAACAERGLFLNRRVFETAESVIVHSPWCLEQARDQGAELAVKTNVIPLGATPAKVDPDRKKAIRSRFGLPTDAVVVASFGYIHPDKMSPEALQAFAEVARVDPAAVFAFVGQEADAGQVKQAAADLGLADRVRFLGRQGDEAFHALASAVDVGVNLRRPPTNGETSAALLDLLRWGVPTIVTDVATFADYPDDAVAKVRWPAGGVAELTRVLVKLCTDVEHRRQMGRAAYDLVDRQHRWPDVAGQYIEVIERAFANRRPASPRNRPARVPARGAS